MLVADHQTAGQGRLDRRWDAPPGANLLVSILFRDVPADPGELTRRVALAAVDACRDGRRRRRHAEVAERPAGRRRASSPGSSPSATPTGPVVVGLGLNVGWAPDGAARLGDGIDPLDVLRARCSRRTTRCPATSAERYRAALGDARADASASSCPTASLEGVADRRRARRPAGRRRRVRASRTASPPATSSTLRDRVTWSTP